jgi:hypothetical protein
LGGGRKFGTYRGFDREEERGREKRRRDGGAVSSRILTS